MEKYTMGLSESELASVQVFINWISDHYMLLRLDNQLIVQLQRFVSKKPTAKTKHEFMQAMLEAGIHAVKTVKPGVVELKWVQTSTHKSFNFLIKQHADKPTEIKLKFTDSKRKMHALAFFLVWATKQTPYDILPAVEFLELAHLFARENFTRAMTTRTLELLLQSQVKSINSFATKLEVELQMEGHRVAHKYVVGTFSRRIRPVEVA